MMQHNLSHREQEVLRLIAYENTNDEIAEKLYISFQTVKTHRKNLLEKLSVKNTAGLVRRSFELGLLQIEQPMDALQPKEKGHWVFGFSILESRGLALKGFIIIGLHLGFLNPTFSQILNGEINWEVRLKSTYYAGETDPHIAGPNSLQDEPTFLFHAHDNTQPLETEFGVNFFTYSCTTIVEGPVPGVDLCVFWDRWHDGPFSCTNPAEATTWPGCDFAWHSSQGAPGTIIDTNYQVSASEIQLGIRLFEDDSYDGFSTDNGGPLRCNCTANIGRSDTGDDPMINAMYSFPIDGSKSLKVETWDVALADTASASVEIMFAFVNGHTRAKPLQFGELAYNSTVSHANTSFDVEGNWNVYRNTSANGDGTRVYSFSVPADGAEVDIDVDTENNDGSYVAVYRSGPSSASLVAATSFGINDLPPISFCRKHPDDTDPTPFTTYRIEIQTNERDAFTISLQTGPTSGCLANIENQLLTDQYRVEFGLPDQTACATGSSYQTYGQRLETDFNNLINSTIIQNFHLLHKGEESVNGLFVEFLPLVINLTKTVRVYHYRQDLSILGASNDLVLALLEEHPMPSGTQFLATNYQLQPPTGSAGDAIVFEIFTGSGDNKLVIAAPLLVTGIDVTSGVLGETVKPDQIDLILYDPPGGESFATFVQDFAVCRTVTRSFTEGSGSNGELKVKFGVKGSLGFIVNTDFELSTSTNLNTTFTRDTSIGVSYRECTKISAGFKTSDDVTGIGDKADLFIGTGEQWEWGFQDSIGLDMTCNLTRDSSFITAVKGETQFVWTKSKIESEMLELQDSITYYQNLINGDPNTAAEIRLDKARKEEQLRIWTEVLNNYNAKKANMSNSISPFNWSLGGGANFYAETVEVSNARSSESNLIFDQAAGQDFTALIGATGIEGGFRVLMNNQISGSITKDSSKSTTIHYEYKDGPGDSHVGVITRDPDFGTHIFHLSNTSKTSCPYEGGVARDQPFIGVSCSPQGPFLDKIYIENINSASEVTLYVQVCNNNMQEARNTSWRLDGNSRNIKYQFNGQAGQQIFNLGFFAAGHCDIMELTFDMNNNNGSYNGLTFRLYPACLEDFETALLDESDDIVVNLTYGGVGNYPTGMIQNCGGCVGTMELNASSGILDGIYTAGSQITLKAGTQFGVGKNITLDAPVVLFEQDNAVPATTILTIKQDGCQN